MSDEPIVELAKVRESRERKKNGAPGGGGPSGDLAPVIRLVPGEEPRVTDEVEGALIAAGSDFYVYGSQLVRPVMAEVKTAAGEKEWIARLVPVTWQNIAEAISRCARLEKYNARQGDYCPCDCPQRLCEMLLAREGKWRFRKLAAIITRPTLRPDYSILDRPGYDEQTGLLFLDGGEAFPEIPDRPTRAQAAAALNFLKVPLAKFPFMTEADKSVALSAILSATIRRSLPTAPMHAFSAPAAGTGKSKLVDIASLIATDRLASVTTQSRKEEEVEKSLGGCFLAGDAVISLDNCGRPIDSPLLCQALTQRSLRIRRLGESRNFDVPSTSSIFATGNNLIIAGDLTRRALLSRLDAKCERPELREFSFDPVELAKKDGGKYLIAALTILRAHHVAGAPSGAPPLGSFVEWSRGPRDALIWLGEPDPCETMKTTRAIDPKLSTLRAVIEQWEAVIGNEEIMLRDVIATANKRTYIPAEERVYPEFRDALLAVAEDRGEIGSVRLGKWLRANEGRVHEGRCFVQGKQHRGIYRWRLDLLEQDLP